MIGRTASGAESDVSGPSSRTSYRTSNPDVATVSAGGLVTAVDQGTAYITASHLGVSAVKRIDVVRQTRKVRIEGFALDGEGQPIAGAAARTTLFGGQAVTGADGFFVLELLLPPGVPVTVSLEYEAAGMKLTAAATLRAPSEDGILDFGELVLAPAASGPLYPEPLVELGYNAQVVTFADLDANGALDVVTADLLQNSIGTLLTHLNAGGAQRFSPAQYTFGASQRGWDLSPAQRVVAVPQGTDRAGVPPPSPGAPARRTRALSEFLGYGRERALPAAQAPGDPAARERGARGVSPSRWRPAGGRQHGSRPPNVVRDLTLDLCTGRVMPLVSTPRSLDLIHLRTAIWFHEREPLTRFVSRDRPQEAAARELGLPV